MERFSWQTRVFIDETGLNLAMNRHYARAKKGKRASSHCPYNRGRNMTLIGAIALRGFLAPFTFKGWTNQAAFLTYVSEVLLPQLWPGACVVMDNLPTHKALKVRELIESVGAQVVFLSPYSPDFNPIENCWSKIKEYLRSQWNLGQGWKNILNNLRLILQPYQFFNSIKLWLEVFPIPRLSIGFSILITLMNHLDGAIPDSHQLVGL